MDFASQEVPENVNTALLNETVEFSAQDAFMMQSGMSAGLCLAHLPYAFMQRLIPDGDVRMTDVSHLAPKQKAPQGEQQENKFFSFVCGFVIISGLVGVIVFLIGFSGDFESENEEEAGSADESVSSGENSGPVGLPPPSPLPRRRVTTPPANRPKPKPPGTSAPSSPAPVTMAPTTTPTTSTTATTTTQPPPLLCSVDHTATVENVYPADGLCDLLIYTHVRVDNSSAVTSLNNDSYTAFISVCDGYANTSCGLSFDSRYADKQAFENQTTQENLRSLPPSMKHMAIMNIYGDTRRLALLALTLPDVLNALHSIRGGDQTRKIIMGVGTFYYLQPDSWKSIEDTITDMLLVTDADIIVLLTAAMGVPNEQECIAVPASAWQSSDPIPPTFEMALAVAMAAVRSPDIISAFAFQMGVVSYSMRDRYNRASEAIYRPCVGGLLAEMSQSCEGTSMEIQPEKTMAGISDIEGKTYFYVFDSLQTMVEKAMDVMNSPFVRDQFTWLLLNVHLTDFSGQCLSNPFERVKNFKTFFHEQKAMPSG